MRKRENAMSDNVDYYNTKEGEFALFRMVEKCIRMILVKIEGEIV